MYRFFEIFWYRRLVAFLTFVGALGVSLLVVKMDRPTYVAVSQVVSVGSSNVSSASVLGLGDITTLALSTNVLERAIHLLKVSLTPDQLRALLTVRSSPHSNIIEISVQSQDEKFSFHAANAVAAAVVKGYQDLAGLQYGQVITSLHKQLDNQKNIIAAVDTKLENAAQGDVIAASSHPLDSITERLSELQGQRAQAQAAFVADSAAANAGLNGNLKNDVELRKVISEQALLGDPYYQALREGQSKDAAEYQFLRASYTHAYPALAGLSSKVASETFAVQRAAASAISGHSGSSMTYAAILMQSRVAGAQVVGDKARLASIDNEISDTQQRLHDLPSLGVPASQMRLERESAAAAYQQLEARLQMTLADQQQASSLNSVIVLNYATNGALKKPFIRTVLTLGLIVLGFSGGSVFLAERVNPQLRDQYDIAEHYRLPLLGSLG